MFDISFSELIVIFIVALIFLGPEKLPRLAYFGGKYFQKLKNFKIKIDSQINHEFLNINSQVEELKKEVDINILNENNDFFLTYQGKDNLLEKKKIKNKYVSRQQKFKFITKNKNKKHDIM